MTARILALVLTLLLVASPACARSRAVRSPGLVIIDVMALYTSDAAAANGGAVMMEQKIQVAVEGLNGDFIRTGIFDVQVRLTSVRQAPSHVTTENFYSDPAVATLRDTARADLVGLWSPSPVGGFGLLPDRNSPDPATGFHAIPSNQWDSHLLAHEIGHNLGLLHEDGICRTDTPAVRDIMSKCEGQTILAPLHRAFTNPAISFAGLPFGGPQDAATIIRTLAPQIARYR